MAFMLELSARVFVICPSGTCCAVDSVYNKKEWDSACTMVMQTVLYLIREYEPVGILHTTALQLHAQYE